MGFATSILRGRLICWLRRVLGRRGSVNGRCPRLDGVWNRKLCSSIFLFRSISKATQREGGREVPSKSAGRWSTICCQLKEVEYGSDG